MLGLLAQAGYHITPRADDAQVVIVNTCSFIGPARDEAAVALGQASRLRLSGNCHVLVAAGCWPQQQPEIVRDLFPSVDAMVGAGEFHRIVPIVEQALARCDAEPLQIIGQPTYLYSHTTPRLRATPPWYAYLKLAEGCNHRCSFCAIPAIRGRFRSRSIRSVVAEARQLVGTGVRELILVAQDTTSYGIDRYRQRMLPSLLRKLSRIKDLRWIRVLYAHPTHLTDELVEVMATEEKVCSYFDLPFQHADADLLRCMHRAGCGDAYLRLIERIRMRLPEVTLRTSLLVGFPGETRAKFRRLLAFLRVAEFDRVGVFAYSREKGTAAAQLPNQVPAQVAQDRRDQLMSEQQGISRGRNRRWVGRTMEVVIEGSDRRGRWLGRSHRDAPEIDGLVYVGAPAKGTPPPRGRFINVRITRTLPYDLISETTDTTALV